MHRYIAALVLASVLVASLAVAGLTPNSYAATRTSPVDMVQVVPNDGSLTIESVSFFAKPTSPDRMDIIVRIQQDGETQDTARTAVKARAEGYESVTVVFDSPVSVDGNFEIAFSGTKYSLDTDSDRDNEVPGYLINKGTERTGEDIDLRINGAVLDSLVSGSSDGPTEPAGEPDPDDSPTAEGTSLVTMLAKNVANNEEIKGMYFEIRRGNEEVAHGFTSFAAPVELDNGVEYNIYATMSYGEIQFAKWQDSGSEVFARAETISQDKTFVALYTAPTTTTDPETDPSTDPDTDPDTTSPPPDETETSGTDGVLTINTILLNGSPAPGFQTQLRDASGTPVATEFSPATFDQMEDGQTYRIIMYSADNTYFRSWHNNGLHRYHSATSADEGKVFTAKYENVPADQAAHLVILAKTTDGTPIGGTTGSDTDGTLSAEAGLEVLVAPPGTLTPYTAGFTGGSEISEHFYFPKGGTYTVVVQEFGQYQFHHWEDNGSESRSRAVPLNGDTTLTAIYEVTP